MAKDLMDEGAEGRNLVFDSEQIVKDVANVVRSREKAGKANGDVGQQIKTLEEQRGYNRKAFNLLCQLAKQSSEGVADFLRTLNAGVEALKLGTEEQPDLFAQQEEAESDDNIRAGDAAKRATKVISEHELEKKRRRKKEKEGEPVH